MSERTLLVVIVLEKSGSGTRAIAGFCVVLSLVLAGALSGGSAASPQVAAAAESFVPLTPVRVLDTRGSARVGAADGNGAPLTWNVLNKGGLPGSGIGAVALNVTVVSGENPTIGGGYVTVYPCGTRPDASNLNFTTGQTIPNTVIAPVAATGDICFYVYGTAHLLADVSGYFPAGSGFTALTPVRVLDTRGSARVGAADGNGAPLTLNVLDKVGLAGSGIGAVALNVTVTNTENPRIGGGYVTVYPCGTRPDASNLNFVRGQTIANSVIAPVSATGDICFYVYGTAHVLADVAGYLPAGPGFTALSTTRVLDTRGSARVGAADGNGAPLTLSVLDKGGLAGSGIGAVALNVTVTDTENPRIGGGYVTVYPCGTRPDASNLNFVGGQTIANSVIAPVSAGGDICFYVYGTGHVLADVTGYVPTAAPTPTTTTTPSSTTSTTSSTTTTITTAPSPPVCDGVTDIGAHECAALVALYDATNGDNWTNNDDWLSPPLACVWYGVTCTANTVTQIDLIGNKLSGPIPPQLGDLTNLQILQLANNLLSGSLPPELGNLTNLQALAAFTNRFSGSIPPEFGNLGNLTRLALSENRLSGPIPPELGNLANLQSLALGFNSLSGSIPPELGDLTSLEVLFLDKNVLSGPVPAGLANLSKLTNLHLSGNGCLTADAATASFVAAFDPVWNDGCL